MEQFRARSRSLLAGAVVAATVLALTPTVAAAQSATTASVAPTVTANGVEVRQEVHHDTSAPLRSMHPSSAPTHAHPIRHAGTGSTSPAGPVRSAPDTSGQRPGVRQIPSTGADFAGITNIDGVLPPDTQGAAGPTQYLALVNSHLAVYSKTGAVLLAPETTNTLWSGFGGGCQTNNDGDGVVLYDALSGHWVVSQFSVTTLPYLECVAVSTTTDATGTWNRYAFQTPAQDAAGDGFADYPKMGVWPDAYYATFNLFNAAGNAGQGSQVCAYDRTKMIAGQAATQQCLQVIGPNAAPLDDDTVLPASVEGATAPPAGSPEYLLTIPQSTSAQSTLLTRSFHVDFTTPANSNLSAQTTLNVSSYTEPCVNVRDCVPQGGSTQKLDAVADRLMARLSYRNLGSRESLVVDQSIVAGSSIGMRWYELTPSAGVLGISQQGTVAPDANFRWMGSISSDKSGDIAMGYSLSSSSVTPQIRYTGRLAGDAAGTMPQGEGTVALGSSGAQTIGNRWGDYTSMTVDPSDDCTFWYSNEYGTSTGDWATRIASFKFPSCGGTVTNDFSMSDSPTSGSVTAGGSATTTVSTAVTAGSAQTVNLTASGLPSGATATFNPTSVTAGNSSTLTIATTSSTPAGTYSITITGTGTSATHTSTYTLTVTAPGGGGGGITNGNFETGTFAGWTTTGTTSIVNSGAHTGTFAAKAGATTPTNGDSTIAQTFTASTGSTGLSFWYNVSCPDTVQFDWATATLRDNTTSTTTTPLAKTCVNGSGWTNVTSSVTAGHSYTLTLTSHDDNFSGDPTFTLFDDVALTSTPPPPPPSGITNGNFEAGTFAGWTTTGTTSIVNSGAHTGTFAGQAGASTATNGDSTIAQTFTPSTGSTGLSFWYNVSCPDTVMFDWATATLTDNTTGTTTTPLAKTCVNGSGWTNVTSSVTAGHSYTLTLTSHDDNFSGDPTFTLFDDVTLS